MIKIQFPYGNRKNPADGICSHFLRRGNDLIIYILTIELGFTKPNKIQFNCATWSADARWLVLGTQTGDLVLWEGEALKVHKLISIPAHKEFFDDGMLKILLIVSIFVGSGRVKENIPITCIALKKHGSDFVTGKI